MKKVIGQYIDGIEKNTIYQKCTFGVKYRGKYYPRIEENIFEDCKFELGAFAGIGERVIFRKCIFNDVCFSGSFNGIIEKCEFKNSTIAWIVKNTDINCSFYHCIFDEASFHNSNLNLKFETYDLQKLCKLKTPCDALVACHFSLGFFDCQLELEGFIANNQAGIIKCEDKDLAKISFLLGINRGYRQLKYREV